MEKKTKRVPKFKVMLYNRYEDPELKMKLVYDVPLKYLPNVITYLEAFRRK